MVRCLAGFAVCCGLLALFYAEENWRGKRAWENCRRALEAQGVKMNWAAYLPAAAPSNENVFGVPEMQRWFTGRGVTALSARMSYPNDEQTNARMVVAELTIELPGRQAPSNNAATVLDLRDAKARDEAGRLIKEAVGPVATHPAGVDFLLRGPKQIRPAQIILRCQAPPTVQQLLAFLPKPIANTESYYSDREKIQVEPAWEGAYKVTMIAPDTVEAFLKWSEQLEPDFEVIRRALRRPYMRMDGDYSEPANIPIPNFVTVRAVVQTLGAMANCHLAAGEPQKALGDLTLMNDLCRIMEGSRPMTLVAAMINVAVRGLYAETIAAGLREHAWREPQLMALEEQLRQIHLFGPVKQALEMEKFSVSRYLEIAPPEALFDSDASFGRGHLTWPAFRATVLGGMVPRGWAYQNMTAAVSLMTDSGLSLNAVRELVFPEKADAGQPVAHPSSIRYWSPYTFLADGLVPSTHKAVQISARNQTEIDQALIACALERYRLAHGQYPETLDALRPRFITTVPHDVIGGKPLLYRRAPDGSFLLYSVGWNGRDDGGVRGKGNEERDWVWTE